MITKNPILPYTFGQINTCMETSDKLSLSLCTTKGGTNSIVAIGATITIKIRWAHKKSNMNKNTCVETARMFQNMRYKNEYLMMMSWAW